MSFFAKVFVQAKEVNDSHRYLEGEGQVGQDQPGNSKSESDS